MEVEVFARWEFYAGLLISVLGLIIGSRFHRGKSRRGTQWYFGSGPWYVRNLAFMSLWSGIAFSFWMAGVLLAGLVRAGASPLRPVALSLFVLGGLSFTVGIVVMFRPPEWAKPEWLQEQEARRRASGRTHPPPSAIDRVTDTATFVVFFVISLSTALLPLLLPLVS